MTSSIYLDYNATTPVDHGVLEAMLPYFSKHFGNASSKGHPYGWHAEEAVNIARDQVGALVGRKDQDVTFTSGATESINMAIKGTAFHYGVPNTHVITAATEHKAVLDTCKAIKSMGASVTVLPVNANGSIDLDQLEDAFSENTRLVSIMWANNETGVVNDIRTIADVCSERGVLFLTDATQACGKIETRSCPADLIALSAHKFYGPKGVGALVSNTKKVIPLVHGGGQQTGRRGGTLNVPGIVGLGAAAKKASEFVEEQQSVTKQLRDKFEHILTTDCTDVLVIGRDEDRLPNTSGIVFSGIPSAKLVPKIRSLAVSTGSACQSNTGQGSHVIRAMGFSKRDSESFLRFSLGLPTTEQEIEQATSQIVRAIGELSSKNLV